MDLRCRGRVRSLFPRAHLGILAAVCLSLSFSLCLQAAPVDELRALTGAQTRVVWVQDAGETACVYSERATLRLMGYDSDDGKGERAILPGIARYWRPLITDDGQSVMFGDLDKETVNIVKWDGSGLRTVLTKAHFEDVWTDPRDGVTWFYATVQEPRGDKTIGAIRRYKLDNPAVSELVWDKMPISQFMVSGDGRAASGGGDGGNTPQGILTLPNGNFIARAGGCWPSMSPDNSLRSWVFTGNHRSIHFGVTTDRSGKGYTYGVEFNKSPGLVLRGNEELYHPRWSNNIRFLTATAPFSEWSYQAEAKIPNHVAEKVEIYLGAFTEDMKGLERWVQVTHNKRGDYWPNAWIKPPPGPPAWLSATPAIAEAAVSDAAPDRTAQVFLWDTGADGNQLNDPKTGAIRQCVAQFRDAARFGRDHVMDLTGGACVPVATAEPWLASVKANGAFAIEAVITPLAEAPTGEGVVLAFADDVETGNLVLSLRGDQLTLRLRGRAGDPLPLVRLPRNQASHVIVSYEPGNLAVFVDGARVLPVSSPSAPLSGWIAQPLIFGDAWRGGRDWPGLLESIGLFGRKMGATEARQRFEAQSKRRAGRKASVDRVVVEAKLVTPCPAADPLGIAPYKRCLSVQQFEIIKTLAGKVSDKLVGVAQWSVLDGRVVPEYLAFKAGQTYRLALESWADHPEQESERMISGDFEEGELFYQVREIAPWPATVTGGADGAEEVWQAVPGQAGLRRLSAPVSVQGQDKPSLFSVASGDKLEAAGQDIIFENGSLTEVVNNGSLRLGGGGAVTAVIAEAGGSGYTLAPKLTLSGGGGQGAVAIPIMAVSNLEFIRLGSGYTSDPVVVIGPPDIYGGRQATAVARVDSANGALRDVRVTDEGRGYLRAPRVTFTGGGGTGVEALATLSVVEGCVLRGGKGYTSPPVATLVGGDGSGAVLQPVLQRTVLRYTDAQGAAFIRNTGSIDQDGAAILFDWAAPQNNTGKRGIENKGTWVMRNGAVIQFGSSTGRPLWVGSFINDGTFRLLDGACIGLQNLQNNGLLQLGAGVVLGYIDLSMGDGVLRNSGEIQVSGDNAKSPVLYGLEHPNTTGKRTVENGTPDGMAKARFTIGNGRSATEFRVMGGQVEFINHPGASLSIQPSATLALTTSDNGSQHLFNNRNAQLTNAGDFTLSGILRVQGNHAGFTGISNKGRLNILGTQAGIERLPSSAGPGANHGDFNASQVQNLAGGEILGSGTFTYTNSTGDPGGNTLRLTNLGTLSPGDERQGGKLTLVGVNVQFGGGLLRILIAGPSKGSALQVTGDANSGRFELADGAANTLNVVAPGGVLPHGRFRIVSAKAVQGTFGALQFNGKSSVKYTVNYLPDAIEVVFP